MRSSLQRFPLHQSLSTVVEPIKPARRARGVQDLVTQPVLLQIQLIQGFGDALEFFGSRAFLLDAPPCNVLQMEMLALEVAMLFLGEVGVFLRLGNSVRAA